MSTSIKDLSTSFELEVTKSRLKIVVVADTLPLTVEQFFGLFVHQDAPFSFKKYAHLWIYALLLFICNANAGTTRR